MAIYYNSNCSSLSVGCYLYNGPGLTNPVANGYYSDGTNCYTVTGGNGYISNIEACSAYNIVVITPYVPDSMTCFSNYTFAMYADNIVDTIVQVEVTWYGDLGGSVTQYVYIPTGTNCGSVSFSSGGQINCIGEYFSLISTVITPPTYGNQLYQEGPPDTSGFYPC